MALCNWIKGVSCDKCTNDRAKCCLIQEVEIPYGEKLPKMCKFMYKGEITHNIESVP